MTELSAHDVMELRLWAKSSGFIRDGEPDRGYPFVVYGRPKVGIEEEGVYYLHSQGVCVAASPRDTVILACLRNERMQPGYVRKLLDTANTIEEALLTPEQIIAIRKRDFEATEHARMARMAAEEAAKRRRSQTVAKSPLDLSLDDLEAL